MQKLILKENSTNLTERRENSGQKEQNQYYQKLCFKLQEDIVQKNEKIEFLMKFFNKKFDSENSEFR